MHQPVDPNLLADELIGAALRYVVVADWFEKRPITRSERVRDHQAMDVFNDVEVALRKAGKRLLRHRGTREELLSLLVPERLRSVRPSAPAPPCPAPE